jgi:hypothetical protein
MFKSVRHRCAPHACHFLQESFVLAFQNVQYIIVICSSHLIVQKSSRMSCFNLTVTQYPFVWVRLSLLWQNTWVDNLRVEGFIFLTVPQVPVIKVGTHTQSKMSLSLFYSTLGPQPKGWCHPHPVQHGLSPLSNSSLGAPSQTHPELCFTNLPSTLSPAKVTIEENHHTIINLSHPLPRFPRVCYSPFHFQPSVWSPFTAVLQWRGSADFFWHTGFVSFGETLRDSCIIG